MIRSLFSVHLLSLLLLLGFVIPTHAQTTATPPAGSGTSGDPYIISTLGELSYVAQNLGATNYYASGVYFLQTAAIDAAATQYWDDADDNSDGDLFNDPNDGTATGNNEGWKPIGNLSSRFYGNYNGGGFAISTLYIDRHYAANGGEIGLFGWLQSGTLENLDIIDAAITVEIDGWYGAAAAVGGAYLATVQNVHIIGGTFTAHPNSSQYYVGPLVGRGSEMTITNCTASMDISSTAPSNLYSPIGGLIGYLEGDVFTVTECAATGNITSPGGNRVGGFAGVLSAGSSGVGTVERCYSTGTLTNTGSGGDRGGFVGNPYLVTIRDCYTLSDISVSSSWSAGGFFGSSPTGPTTKPTFINCYAAGSFLATTGYGFGGYANETNTYTNCFWDATTLGTTTGVPNGREGSLAGNGLTTAEMQTAPTFVVAGWDWVFEATNGVDDYWAINPEYNEGYPFLEWSGFPIGAEHGGYALEFDGVDDYVEVSAHADLNMAGSSFTIELWVWGDETLSYSSERLLVEAGTGWTTGTYQVSSSGDDRIHVNFNGNSSGGLEVTYDWTDSKWHHVAGVFDNSGNQLRLYIDGKLVGSITENNAPGSATPPLYLGSRGGTEKFSNVKMDEVRIWSDVRTQAEIQANMHKELSGNETNLVAYYSMHDGSGTYLTDNSHNERIGTLNNGPSWNTSGAHAGPGMALDFDGTDDYVSLPADLTDLTAAFTLETWVKPEDISLAGGWRRRIVSLAGSNDLDVAVMGDLTVGFRTSNGPLSQVSSATVATNTWNHLALVFDGSTYSMYLNGKSTPLSDGGLTDLGGGSNSFIGNIAGNLAPFDGQIDEVRIWSAARTEAEILANMYRTLDGDETGLAAYYRFDQQADAANGTLYDQTANANHGTLTNMAPATDWVASSPFNTWIGSEDGDWNNADNWSRSVVPGTEDVGVFSWVANSSPASANISARHFYLDAGVTMNHGGNLTLSGDYYSAGTFNNSGIVTFSGSEAQAIRGSGSSTFGTAVIDNAGGVSLEQDLTASSGLTLTDGLFTLGEHSLTLGSGATISGASSSRYLVTSGSGGLIRPVGGTNVAFPVGNSSYNPLTLNNAGTSDDFTVRVSDNVLTEATTGSQMASRLVDRTWFVSEAAAGGSDVTLTFQWEAVDELPDFDRSKAVVKHFYGGQWNDEGLSGAASGAGPYTYAVSGISSFSPFALGDDATSFPVEWLAFDVQRQAAQVQLDWATAREQNTAHFAIERSADQQAWQEIGQVSAAGYAETRRDYRFTDQRPLTNQSYYRLRQVDLDGGFSYSELRSVSYEALLRVYPNPVVDVLTIDVPGPGWTAELYDGQGRRLRQQAVDRPEMNLSDLPAGSYVLRLRGPEGQQWRGSVVK